MCSENFVVEASSEQEMEALGRELALALLAVRTPLPPATIFLSGQLGAGKTTLARGFLRAAGVEGRVKSPTYSLVEPYVTPCGLLAHFDFYRLIDAREVEFLGLREYLEDHVCLFEWPERAPGMLPAPDLEVHIDAEATPRRLRIRAPTVLGRALLARLEGVNQYPESISKT